MSNNAAVTQDHGEIGRAQALQARACYIAPSIHMNPVLLKPQSSTGSQIIVQGKLIAKAEAGDYQKLKPGLLAAVLESFNHLRAEADLVIIEGAGSASEINLRANDIANMGFASAADVPVILVGDIDRGGVIAQIVGTKHVIDPLDAGRIEGFLVNKFRGDPRLFASGLATIERLTGWPSLGLISFCEAAKDLPAEDRMGLAQQAPSCGRKEQVTIVVPILPSIANFDDLDPLLMEPNVRVLMIEPGMPLPLDADLILLIGSKTTIADLMVFRAQGWNIDLAAHVRRGGFVLGLCGGYQMLGTALHDPLGLEGPPAEVAGLGLLDFETEFSDHKELGRVEGHCSLNSVPFTGYEMHNGVSFGRACARPLVVFSDGRPDGAVSKNGKIAGCYVHGFFNHDAQRAAWLERLGAPAQGFSYEERIETALDALADQLESQIDLDRLLKIAR
jgi:adenosylcobyric acid synthase